MAFARKVWHLLVAIKDGLVLLFMLLFFMALYAVLTARPSAGQLRDGALLIKLDGVVLEEPSVQDPFEALLASEAPTQEYRARDLVRALELAADDKRIKTVVLDLSRFMGGGLVHMQDIGAALDKVRAANKPVLTYAVAYVDDGMMLAAHSSEVWVDPMGGAYVVGPGGHMPYYGGLLERLKITPHIYRVGTFKDAVEPYTRNGLSPESRTAREALYAAIWESWKADVAKARPKADIARVTSDQVGWIRAANGDAAQAAKAAGLIDRIGDKVAFGERVKQVAGADPLSDLPGKYARNAPEVLLAAHPEKTPGEAIAVVTVAGEIVDGKAGPGIAGGTRIARLIDEAKADEAGALVLRVDSPGGSMLASEEIRLALERFKAEGKPVVVSMANVAASGGYWVATPADRIFAEPGSVTGSIGVFAVIPSFEKALSGWGVTSDGVRTTPLSGQPDLIGGFTPELDAIMQSGVENGYARFIALVAKARKKSPVEVERFAEGRVWDGGTARQLGLVDQFGGLDDALAHAAKAAKLESWHARDYNSDADPYASLIDRLGGGEEEQDESAGAGRDIFALVAERQQTRLAAALAEMSWLSGARGAQVYCLECPALPPVRAAQTGKGWLAQLAAVLGIG
jgi:protease-4